jgi:transposase-like protein
MRAASIAETALGVPVCPLCHTCDQVVTPESLAAGATWACTTCGQSWSAERLETVAAYAQYAAARGARLS